MGLQKTKRLFNRKTSIFFWCSQNYKYQNLWTHLRENRMAEEWKPEMLFYILSVNNFYIKLTTKKLFFGNRGKNMEKVRNTTWGKWDKINSFSQKKVPFFVIERILLTVKLFFAVSMPLIWILNGIQARKINEHVEYIIWNSIGDIFDENAIKIQSFQLSANIIYFSYPNDYSVQTRYIVYHTSLKLYIFYSSQTEKCIATNI